MTIIRTKLKVWTKWTNWMKVILKSVVIGDGNAKVHRNARLQFVKIIEAM